MKTGILRTRLLSILAAMLMLCGAGHAADALAANMFRHIVAENDAGNVVFSPASVEAVLHTLRDGTAGDTRKELAALPYGKRGVASAMRVECANAIFADMKRDEVKKNIHFRYAPFLSQPDTAVAQVNAWCRENTHGRIVSILDKKLPPRTRLIALNAVYLKETWLRPFPAEQTQREYFVPHSGKKQVVTMMSLETPLRYAEGKDWQAVALPYRSQQQGEPGYFIGILPRGNARAFAATLTPDKLAAICKALSHARPEPTLVNLPRFEISAPAISLAPALKALGVNLVFSEAADFSELTTVPLSLKDVLQKCYVKVDEEGTEAAAVTAAIGVDCCMPLDDKLHRICFNRPFLWIIGDLTTEAPPYFMGLTEDIAPAE